jgi:hypothetical protein
MLRGENHCKIEENVIAGIPDLSSTHFKIPEDIFQKAEIPRDVKSKFRTHSYGNMAGGIDPNTGYSRRIMTYLENRDEIKPLLEKEKKVAIPDYSKFIAAEVTPSPLAAASALPTNSENDVRGDHARWWWWKMGIAVAIAALTATLLLWRRTKRRN